MQTKKTLKSKLSRGESMLQKNGLIQFCNEDGLANHEKYNLTVKAKQEFLSELNMNLNATTRFKELIRHEDITECKMYYNKRESRQVEQLKARRHEALCAGRRIGRIQIHYKTKKGRGESLMPAF